MLYLFEKYTLSGSRVFSWRHFSSVPVQRLAYLKS